MPGGEGHLDWLVESVGPDEGAGANPDQRSLAAFRLAARLDCLVPGQALEATRISDHRRLYLDYEGLLSENRGKRLLVSGVNRATTHADIYRMTGLSPERFKCCVDVGYAAHDTTCNAEETRAWASAHRFSKLIIVTSSYHMPRSLVELGRVMPATTLVLYPVVSRNFRTEAWWLHAATARLLFSEYVKFLPSAARMYVARLRNWDGSALANGVALRASGG